MVVGLILFLVALYGLLLSSAKLAGLRRIHFEELDAVPPTRMVYNGKATGWERPQA